MSVVEGTEQKKFENHWIKKSALLNSALESHYFDAVPPVPGRQNDPAPATTRSA
jgi:hypothetical protein